jgi:O-antigen biosynthesis protein
MKKLSIIIVNYNVEFFLEQCLRSVFDALEGIDGEVFVVDNNSVDQSMEMVRQKFPDVILIENKQNLGFSRANNQAIKQAAGEYILLLNPDTLVQKDTFSKTIGFMDTHADAGGLGVQMIDGKGNFLPESKRGLPTPWVAFYRIFGLSRLFPNSRRFGRYHLSYLDRSKNHEVDVLSGAFMMLRKSVLDQTGLLDETFFMYGEDIDLSYRITKAGMKNYYFAETKIIHYKGESTKKGSLNYVLTFYNAMKIFAEKHYSDNKLRFFSFLINIAILLRAGMAIFHRFFKRILLPLIDFALITGGFYLITHYWQKLIIFPDGGHYPQMLVYFALPAYVLTWMFTSYLSGIYDKTVKIENLLKGVIAGTIVILLVYSVLDVSMRFSRALIFLGSAWAFISMFLVRLSAKRIDFRSGSFARRKFIIAGDEDEAERVKDILVNSSSVPPLFVGFVSPDQHKPNHPDYVGVFTQLDEIIRIYGIHEVIFCSKNISSAMIIQQMAALHHVSVDIKIAPADSVFIIGSNSINAAGDVYVMNVINIDKPENRRNKRTLDVITSLLFLLFFPVMLWFVKQPHRFFINIFKVIAGKFSWVGFSPATDSAKLPKMKRGILNPADQIEGIKQTDIETVQNLNILYARDYKISLDLKIIMKALRKTGRKV